MAFLNNNSISDKNSTRVAEIFCKECSHPFRGKIDKRRTDGKFRYLQFVNSNPNDTPWHHCPNCDEVNKLDYYYMFAEN